MEEKLLKAEIIENGGFERNSMQLWVEGGQKMFWWARVIGMAKRNHALHVPSYLMRSDSN